MTFKQAEKKLKRMVGDKYRSVYFERNHDGRGAVREECKLYVHEGHMICAPTWEKAFKKLEVVLGR